MRVMCVHALMHVCACVHKWYGLFVRRRILSVVAAEGHGQDGLMSGV